MFGQLWDLLSNSQSRAALQLGGLIFARLAPIIIFTPAFGGTLVPRRFTTGLCAMLTFLLYLSVAPMSPEPIETFGYATLLAKELLLGTTLAVLVNLLFEVLPSVGTLAETVRGGMDFLMYDPLRSEQTPVLSGFYMQMGIVVFATAGGFRMLLGALSESFQLLPPTRFLNLQGVLGGSFQEVVFYFSTLIWLTLKLAAPVVVTLFFIDVALGLLNRIAPGLNAWALSRTANGWLGILLALLSFGLVIDLAGKQAGTLVEHTIAWFRSLAGG